MSNTPTGDELDAAIRDVIDAVKHAQRLGHAHVGFFNGAYDAFCDANHIGSTFDNEDGEAKYGKVKEQDHGYLSRLIYRGDNVLFQLYHDVPVRAEV